MNKIMLEFLPCSDQTTQGRNPDNFFYFGRNDDFINWFWNLLTFGYYKIRSNSIVPQSTCNCSKQDDGIDKLFITVNDHILKSHLIFFSGNVFTGYLSKLCVYPGLKIRKNVVKFKCDFVNCLAILCTFWRSYYITRWE